MSPARVVEVMAPVASAVDAARGDRVSRSHRPVPIEGQHPMALISRHLEHEPSRPSAP